VGGGEIIPGRGLKETLSHHNLLWKDGKKSTSKRGGVSGPFGGKSRGLERRVRGREEGKFWVLKITRRGGHLIKKTLTLGRGKMQRVCKREFLAGTQLLSVGLGEKKGPFNGPGRNIENGAKTRKNTKEEGGGVGSLSGEGIELHRGPEDRGERTERGS